MQPYRKPNDTPMYINSKSNHPINIKQSLLKIISKRMSLIISSKEEFYKATLDYNDALKRSGYQEEIKYWPQVTDKEKEKTKSKRKRNIM